LVRPLSRDDITVFQVGSRVDQNTGLPVSETPRPETSTYHAMTTLAFPSPLFVYPHVLPLACRYRLRVYVRYIYIFCGTTDLTVFQTDLRVDQNTGLGNTSTHHYMTVTLVFSSPLFVYPCTNAPRKALTIRVCSPVFPRYTVRTSVDLIGGVKYWTHPDDPSLHHVPHVFKGGNFDEER
jgi:hypothetical protein